ncbi:MBL fold metallo-hydrolase [Rhodococcus sp. UFZ-B548]|uniref:MBL fold metallo-hydrolase n=1 Tax=Rhodococcus sp. UFZ-B548 TaxID=2742212 RepID=UPI0015F74C37|nr:MBL fold metallo-hydrolase [Rhodococcus sp. UFZ-B548]
MSFGIDIGSARVTQLTEMAHWPFAARDLFPLISDAEVEAASRLLAEPFVDRPSGDLVLAIHTYVVEIGGKTIVVDTGNGNDKNRPNLLPHHMFDTDYLTRFAATGIGIDNVDAVISTHLHPDHCGWNTKLDAGVWKPTFPGATYIFGRIELEGLERLAAAGAGEGVVSDLVKTFEDSVRPVLDEAAWVAVDDGYVLAEHEGTAVVVRVAPGHTGGHLTVEIQTPDGGAVISGDVIHHPIQFLFPDLCQGGDADPAVSLRTRTALLDRCAREGLLLLPAHFPVDEPIPVGFNAIGFPEAAFFLAAREPAVDLRRAQRPGMQPTQ